MATGKVDEVVRGQLDSARYMAGIDDELYRWMLFGSILLGVAPDKHGVQWFMDSIRNMSARLKEEHIDTVKYQLREATLFYLEEKIVGRGYSFVKTINRYAREAFEIESYRWLRLDQLAELLWIIHKETQHS
jgi:hypothetical protein